MARRPVAAVAAPSKFPIAFVVKLFRGLLILALVVVLVLGGAAAMLSYRVMTAQNDTETVTPLSYLLTSYVPLNFTDRAGGEHEGWLLLGRVKGAPAIILCPGYNSNRSDMLSLGTILRENHFNVYVFNFSGAKAKERFSDLGVRQAQDVLQAIETVTRQRGINPHRVGLYGTNLGGYAALVAAMQSPKVQALAVDTIYTRPEQMFEIQVDQALGGSSPLFQYLSDAEFRLFTWGSKPYPVRANLAKLANVRKLFVSGRDTPALADVTEGLYNAAPPPKELRVLNHSQATLSTRAEKKEFENQILNFFLQNLSLRAD